MKIRNEIFVIVVCSLLIAMVALPAVQTTNVERNHVIENSISLEDENLQNIIVNEEVLPWEPFISLCWRRDTNNNEVYTWHSADSVRVDGYIKSTSGGYIFPDGSVQDTAASGGGGTDLDWIWVGDRKVNSYPVYHLGRVGIGTDSIQAKLHVKGTGFPDSYIYLESESGGDTGIRFYNGGAHTGSLFYDESEDIVRLSHADTPITQIVCDKNGNVGIGTNNPNEKLHVAGRVKCGTLEITGGSDIAEPFDIVEDVTIMPGMVVVIDPHNPGQLTVSKEAYDTCVAGVISGAGGIKPGLTLTQETMFDGTQNVALAGRVYARCDASYGKIEPGDLLTTSSTPGYAMKITDYDKANGAILGKAMTSLNDGQGLVLILVSLQ